MEIPEMGTLNTRSLGAERLVADVAPHHVVEGVDDHQDGHEDRNPQHGRKKLEAGSLKNFKFRTCKL
jgi:hypothetical protein